MNSPRSPRRLLVLGGMVALGLLVCIGVFLLDFDVQRSATRAVVMAGLVMIPVVIVIEGRSRGPWFQHLAAMAPIPLGFGVWFTGMAFAFDGGGDWTGWMMEGGALMMIVGVVTTVIVICTPKKK